MPDARPVPPPSLPARPAAPTPDAPSVASPAITPPSQWDCKPGKVVFQEGEESYDLLILEEGTVDIFVGNEKLASLEGPGVFLGEVGALLRKPRSAKVKAITPCRFTVYKDFDSLMAHDPRALLKIAKSLAGRLSDSNEHFEKQVTRAFSVLRHHKIKPEILDEVDTVFSGQKKKKSSPEARRSFLGLFHF